MLCRIFGLDLKAITISSPKADLVKSTTTLAPVINFEKIPREVPTSCFLGVA